MHLEILVARLVGFDMLLESSCFGLTWLRH